METNYATPADLFRLWTKIRASMNDQSVLVSVLSSWHQGCGEIKALLLLEPAERLVMQQTLCALSDLIYADARRQSWSPVYRELLASIEPLLAGPELESLYLRSQLKPDFVQTSEQLQRILERSDIDSDMVNAVRVSLRALRAGNQDLGRAIAHLQKCLQELNECGDIAGQLPNLLIRWNFNHQVMLEIMLSRYETTLLNKGGLNEQQEWLMDEYRKLKFLRMNQDAPLFKDGWHLADRLLEYLSAQLNWIQERLAQRRDELSDAARQRDGDRMELKLPVTMLGLLIRLLLAMGILPDQDINATFSFFARRFYTPKTPLISPHSLQNKSNSIDFNTALKMKELLIRMLNWLNANYNVSNYKG